MSSSRFRPLALAFSLALSLGACQSWHRRPVASPEPDRFVSLRGPVRVTRAEGPPSVLVGVRISRDSLFGNERVKPHGRVAIAVSDVRRVETRRVNPLATGAVVVLLVTAFIAATGAFVIHTVVD